MTCSFVNVDGHPVIVCGKIKLFPCSACGEIATRECDWKVGQGRTCDASLCEKCTSSPARNKDLCPEHAEAWAADPDNPKNIQPSFDFET